VQFKGNEAQASVSFKPKSSPDAGMTMPYTLDRRGGKWVVRRRAESGMPHGGGAAPQTPSAPQGGPGMGAGDLPPGHPPVSSTPPGGAKK
jgi:hypothetical protein